MQTFTVVYMQTLCAARCGTSAHAVLCDSCVRELTATLRDIAIGSVQQEPVPSEQPTLVDYTPGLADQLALLVAHHGEDEYIDLAHTLRETITDWADVLLDEHPDLPAPRGSSVPALAGWMSMQPTALALLPGAGRLRADVLHVASRVRALLSPPVPVQRDATTSRLMCACCATPARPRRATPGYRTCDVCADKIQEMLSEIVTRYATLWTVQALLPVKGENGRRGPGFASRSPARDTVIAVTDPRTTWTADDRLHNPQNVLAAWAAMVREEVGEAAVTASIHADADLLARRLDYITRQEWVADLWRELREVRSQLRAITGEHGPVKVGHCPNALDDGNACETPLFAPLTGDTIRCSACRRQWARPEWQHLGRTMGVTA